MIDQSLGGYSSKITPQRSYKIAAIFCRFRGKLEQSHQGARCDAARVVYMIRPEVYTCGSPIGAPIRVNPGLMYLWDGEAYSES